MSDSQASQWANDENRAPNGHQQQQQTQELLSRLNQNSDLQRQQQLAARRDSDPRFNKPKTPEPSWTAHRIPDLDSVRSDPLYQDLMLELQRLEENVSRQTNNYSRQQQQQHSVSPLVPECKERPRFTQRNMPERIEIEETQNCEFMCRLEPSWDPSMQVDWFHNGEPLREGSRYTVEFDFGVARLIIRHCEDHDSGIYQCRARNLLGEATSSGTLRVKTQAKVQYDTLNPTGLSKIIALENPPAFEETVEQQVGVAPKFVTQIADYVEKDESQSLHLECQLAPVDDPNMKTEWFFNGRPLVTGSRFHTIDDFGFIVLDIDWLFPRDTGEYVCRASNKHGSDLTRCVLRVRPDKNIVLDSQLDDPNLIDKLNLLEYPIVEEPEFREDVQKPAHFVQPLSSLNGKHFFQEGENVHFEARVAPATDGQLTVEWFHNGKALMSGHRFKPAFDFGHILLDILYVYPEDAGLYKCVASNANGSDSSELEIAVQAKPALDYRTQLPEDMVGGVQKLTNMEAMWNQPAEPEEEEPAQERIAPQFVLKPIPCTAFEGNCARFCCRIIGHPRPRLTWTLNGQTIFSGSRYKLTYDGMYHLTILKCQLSDAGKVEVYARNPLGDCLAMTQLEVRPKVDDYRNVLKKSPNPWYDEQVLRAYRRQRLADNGELDLDQLDSSSSANASLMSTPLIGVGVGAAAQANQMPRLTLPSGLSVVNYMEPGTPDVNLLAAGSPLLAPGPAHPAAAQAQATKTPAPSTIGRALKTRDAIKSPNEKSYVIEDHGRPSHSALHVPIEGNDRQNYLLRPNQDGKQRFHHEPSQDELRQRQQAPNTINNNNNNYSQQQQQTTTRTTTIESYDEYNPNQANNVIRAHSPHQLLTSPDQRQQVARLSPKQQNIQQQQNQYQQHSREPSVNSRQQQQQQAHKHVHFQTEAPTNEQDRYETEIHDELYHLTIVNCQLTDSDADRMRVYAHSPLGDRFEMTQLNVRPEHLRSISPQLNPNNNSPNNSPTIGRQSPHNVNVSPRISIQQQQQQGAPQMVRLSPNEQAIQATRLSPKNNLSPNNFPDSQRVHSPLGPTPPAEVARAATPSTISRALHTRDTIPSPSEKSYVIEDHGRPTHSALHVAIEAAEPMPLQIDPHTGKPRFHYEPSEDELRKRQTPSLLQHPDTNKYEQKHDNPIERQRQEDLARKLQRQRQQAAIVAAAATSDPINSNNLFGYSPRAPLGAATTKSPTQAQVWREQQATTTSGKPPNSSDSSQLQKQQQQQAQFDRQQDQFEQEQNRIIELRKQQEEEAQIRKQQILLKQQQQAEQAQHRAAAAAAIKQQAAQQEAAMAAAAKQQRQVRAGSEARRSVSRTGTPGPEEGVSGKEVHLHTQQQTLVERRENKEIRRDIIEREIFEQEHKGAITLVERAHTPQRSSLVDAKNNQNNWSRSSSMQRNTKQVHFEAEPHILNEDQEDMMLIDSMGDADSIASDGMIPPEFTQKIQPCQAIEGDEASFECSFVGDPEPNISWFRESRPIKQSNLYQISTNEYTSKLIIKRVTMNSNAVFTVKADNPAGSAKSSANLVVEAHPRPETNRGGRAVQIDADHYVFNDQDFGELQNDNSEAQGQNIQTKQQLGHSTIATAKTNIISQQQQSATTISKTLDNIEDMNTATGQVVSVRTRKLSPDDLAAMIRRSPEGLVAPSFLHSLHDIVSRPGELIRLDARVLGSGPLEVRWLKDGIRLRADKLHKMLLEADLYTLLILECSLEDSGTYECVVANRVGEARCRAKLLVSNQIVSSRSRTPEPFNSQQRPGSAASSVSSSFATATGANLVGLTRRSESPGSQTTTTTGSSSNNIADSIPKIIKRLESQSVGEGNSVTLRCQISSFPVLPQVQWFKDGDQLIKPSRYFRIFKDNDETYCLRISEAFPEDAGEYKCVARALNGRSYVETRAQVTVL